MRMMMKISPTSWSSPSGCRPRVREMQGGAPLGWMDTHSPVTRTRRWGGKDIWKQRHIGSDHPSSRSPHSACMSPGRGSSPPKFRLALPGGWPLHSGESCPLWTTLGQVATGPALQQDDLMAQGAETQNCIKLHPHMGLPSWRRW